MIPTLHTARLILRPIEADDAEAIFAMDCDAEVHTYLGGRPVTHIDQIHAAIAMIQAQYAQHGTGRLAVLLRENGECIGWAGLKWMREPVDGRVEYYDLGYRLQRAHWGNGYATEAGRALLDHGFGEMGLDAIHAIVHRDNAGSRNVLTKLGFALGKGFEHEDLPHVWFHLHSPR